MPSNDLLPFQKEFLHIYENTMQIWSPFDTKQIPNTFQGREISGVIIDEYTSFFNKITFDEYATSFKDKGYPSADVFLTSRIISKENPKNRNPQDSSPRMFFVKAAGVSKEFSSFEQARFFAKTTHERLLKKAIMDEYGDAKDFGVF